KARQRDDLDIALVERVLEETRPARSDIYLWGGEPLVYAEWDRLVELLEADPRWTVMCTNGIGLDRRVESLARLGPNLVCLVSVDGLEEHNDAIRGRQTFRRAMAGIEALLAARAAGEFGGEVSVSAVLSHELIPQLVEFVAHFDELGVNTLYLVFPWHIPGEMAGAMDHWFDANFGWLMAEDVAPPRPGAPSWHSYRFRIPEDDVDLLRMKMQELRERSWRIRVRFRPDLELDEVGGFVRGSAEPAEGRTRCLSVASRLSVLPSGQVTTCKLFPEFAVGDLNESSLRDVWHGVRAHRARSALACGLTPVCSKCVQLYLGSA
ncbi:MAG: hypothetical protein QOJ29_2250, partial [Thermoleophilaceae bacterium]|nr:hypothetical protein [Thermoleophilaceae bacterium]